MRRARSLSSILSDNTSGAQAITHDVAQLIVRLCGQRRAAREIGDALSDIAERVLRAHPAMVSLSNLFNRLLIALDRQPGRPAVIARAVRQFQRGFKRNNEKIASAAARLIKEGAVVLTHSASRTVEDGLRRPWDGGKRFHVVCTESRPAREGALLARALALRGIPTTLVADALASSIIKGGVERIDKPDLILVGADAVSPRGIVNKAGTLGLAVAAQTWSVPFYVLASSEKFAPREYPLEKAIRDKPPGEILARAPKRLRVVNRYFDLTPLEYATAIVSEDGVLRPGRMHKTLSSIRIHPDLKRILETL